MHRAQVNVGFAGARFHLHSEVRKRAGRCAVVQLHYFQCGGRLDAMHFLHRVQIFPPLFIVDYALVRHAALGELQTGKLIVS